MTERAADSSPRLKARTAGLLYLINLIMNGIAIFVLTKVMAPGDAAATAHNILASEQLFRYGFAADLIGALCYVGVTLLLYKLFKAVSESVSLLAAFLSLVAVAIGGANLVNLMAPLVLLGGAPYLHTIAPGGWLSDIGGLFLILYDRDRRPGRPVDVHASNHRRAADHRKRVRANLLFREFPCAAIRGPSLPGHSGARYRRRRIADAMAPHRRCEREEVERTGRRNKLNPIQGAPSRSSAATVSTRNSCDV